MINQWLQDPEFAALPYDQQKQIASNYFDSNLVDDDFRVLSGQEQFQIKENFLAANGIKPKAPEPTAGQGAMDTLRAVGAGAGMLPRQIVARGLSMVRGADIDTTPGPIDRFISGTDKQTEEYLSQYGQNDQSSFLGVTPRDVAEAMGNLAYSGISMAAGLGAAGIAAAVTGGNPIAGYTAGMLAAGGTAYRGTKDQITQQFFDSLNEQSIQDRGVPLSENEWQQARADFEDKATRYGLWEAIPEAIGSAVGFKFITAPLKAVVGERLAGTMLGKLGAIAGKTAGAFGEELLTETVTQAGLPGAESGGKWKGQAGIEAEAGMRPRDISFGEGFKEIYGPVMATTAILGPLAAGGHYAYNRMMAPKASDEQDLLNPNAPTREKQSNEQFLQQVFDGLNDGSITLEHIDALIRNMPPDDPKRAVLTGIFQESQPTPGMYRQPAGADYEARVRNQEMINQGISPMEQGGAPGGMAPPGAGATPAAPGPVPAQIGQQITGEPVSGPAMGVQLPPEAIQSRINAQLRDQQEREMERNRAAEIHRRGMMPRVSQPEIPSGPPQMTFDQTQYIQNQQINPPVSRSPFPAQGFGGMQGRQEPTRPAGPILPEEFVPQTEGEILDLEANEAATSPKNARPQPSDDMLKAGNFKKGHPRPELTRGFSVTIENPKGSVRTQAKPTGAPDDWVPGWSTEMKSHYGYFKRSLGKDGDQIDVFLSDNPNTGKSFIIDQVDPKTGKFDEHKVMMGYPDTESASQAYLENFDPGWKGLGAITEVSDQQLKEFVGSGTRQTKAYSVLKSKPSTFQPGAEGIVDPGEAINRHIQEKYSEILSLPEEDNFNFGDPGIEHTLDKISDYSAKPGTVKAALRRAAKIGKVRQVVQAIRISVANSLGDLHETYRYESTEEGKALEAYLDSILKAVEDYPIPRSVPPAGGSPAPAGTPPQGAPGPVPGTPRIDIEKIASDLGIKYLGEVNGFAQFGVPIVKNGKEIETTASLPIAEVTLENVEKLKNKTQERFQPKEAGAAKPGELTAKQRATLVETKVVNENTGKVVTMKDTAGSILDEIDDLMEKYLALLGCVS